MTVAISIVGVAAFLAIMISAALAIRYLAALARVWPHLREGEALRYLLALGFFNDAAAEKAVSEPGLSAHRALLARRRIAARAIFATVAGVFLAVIVLMVGRDAGL